MGDAAEKFDNLSDEAEAFVADAKPVVAWIEHTLALPAAANLEQQIGYAMRHSVGAVLLAARVLLPRLRAVGDERSAAISEDVADLAERADELVDTLSWFVEAAEKLVKLARDEACA